MYELDCRYDSRQSFYGKAQVKETPYIGLNLIELYSYGTLVAKILYAYIDNTTKITYLLIINNKKHIIKGVS